MKPAWAQRSKGMHILYRCVLFLAWSYCKICYRNRAYGHEHFFKGGAVIASNHTSFLDPILLSVSWPEEVQFLARETLFKTPGFGAFIRRAITRPGPARRIGRHGGTVFGRLGPRSRRSVGGCSGRGWSGNVLPRNGNASPWPALGGRRTGVG